MPQCFLYGAFTVVLMLNKHQRFIFTIQLWQKMFLHSLGRWRTGHKTKAEIIKHAMILDVLYECSKSSFFRVPVILGTSRVQSSVPTDLNSHRSYPAVQIPVSLPGYNENVERELCPPIWDPSPPPSYSFLSSSLSPLLRRNSALLLCFISCFQLHCFFHISWAQKAGERWALSFSLFTSSVTPDRRTFTSHDSSVLALS